MPRRGRPFKDFSGGPQYVPSYEVVTTEVCMMCTREWKPGAKRCQYKQCGGTIRYTETSIEIQRIREIA